MPLLSGKSKKTIGRNIAEMMHAFKEKGHIGNSPDESPEKARKRATIIALKKSGLSRYNSK